MQLSYGTASHGTTVPGIDLTWASQSGRLGSDEAELGDHRLIAVCTVDTVTTLSAERATDPTTLCLLSSAAAQPTIISIFPRPARRVISANQDGRKVDNHIHIAASNSLPDNLRWTDHRNIIRKYFQQFHCSFLSSLWWHSCYSLNSKCLGCYLCINQSPVWSKLNYVKSSFSDLLFSNLPRCSSNSSSRKAAGGGASRYDEKNTSEDSEISVTVDESQPADRRQEDSKMSRRKQTKPLRLNEEEEIQTGKLILILFVVSDWWLWRCLGHCTPRDINCYLTGREAALGGTVHRDPLHGLSFDYCQHCSSWADWGEREGNI